MVVIEPESELVTQPPLKESIADSAPLGSAEDEGSGSDDECFEDALTDEQLLEVGLPLCLICLVILFGSLFELVPIRTKLVLGSVDLISSSTSLREQKAKLMIRKHRETCYSVPGSTRKQSQYELAMEIASEIPSSEEICSMCHANRAICFSMLGKYEETFKECTQALELNPSYLKALLRRVEAHQKLEHYDEAISDMKKIVELLQMNKREEHCGTSSLWQQKKEKR